MFIYIVLVEYLVSSDFDILLVFISTYELLKTTTI